MVLHPAKVPNHQPELASVPSAETPFWAWSALLLLGCGYALANGMSFGTGNLWQYLLHGRHALDPTFLANDWLTTQTRPHHAAFAWAISVAGRIAPLEIIFAIANAIAAAVCVACYYLLAARYFSAPLAVTALSVLITVFSPASGIAMTSLMTPYFQPSTIGGVGLLAALVCILHDRYKTAGLLLFIAAIFHINIMVWAGLLVGGVFVLHWRKLGLRGGLYLLLPLATAFLYHLPFFLASRTAEQLECSAASSHILFDIYMPAHFRPLTWGAEPFARFGATLVAGLLAYRAIDFKRPPNRLAISILFLIAGLLALGMLLTISFRVSVVTLLFPYRLAPYLYFTSNLLVAAALISTAMTPRLSWVRTIGLWCALAWLLYLAGIESRYQLAVIFSAVIALAAQRLAAAEQTPLAWSIALAGGLTTALWGAGAGVRGSAVAAFFLGSSLMAVTWRRWRRPLLGSNKLPEAGRVIIPLLIAALLTEIGTARKDFLGPIPPVDEQRLYTWCRTYTDREAVFVIPPDLSRFRLGAERAIVIDARCIGVLPGDVMEWYQRLKDECGGDFESLSQANAGFAQMDTERALRVAEHYGATYLLAYRTGHRGNQRSLPMVYDNSTFAVYRVN